MIEDDIYRSSTQYRRWSFTADQLATQRKEANEYAAAKVCAAFQRVKTTNGTAKSWTGNDEAGGRADSQQDVDTLTVEEELKIVEWGCGKIQEMGTALRLPKSLIVSSLLINWITHSQISCTNHLDCRPQQCSTSADST